MSLSYAPKVVTDGLVFYYDQANTKKSWLGAPTTNLQSTPATSNYGQYGPFVPTITQSDTVPTTYGTNRNVLRVRCSTTDWGPCFYWGPPALIAGTTYTVSFYARTIDIASASMRFSNQNGSGDENSLSHSHTITTQWQRYTYTQQLDVAKNIFYVWGTNGATLEFADFQIEASSWATPFVAGTRTSSNNLVSIVGTVNSVSTNLTYNTDNTFTFNSSSNSIDFNLPSGLTGTGSWTMGAWFKVNGAPGNASWQNVIVDTDATGGSANMIAVDWGGYHGGSQNQLVYSTRPSTGGGYTNLLGPVLTQGTWYHVMVVRNATINTQLYVNGVLNNTYNGNMPTATQPLVRVGRWTDGTNYANATIPAVQVYSQALTAQQVQQNFAAQRGRYGL